MIRATYWLATRVHMFPFIAFAPTALRPLMGSDVRWVSVVLRPDLRCYAFRQPFACSAFVGAYCAQGARFANSNDPVPLAGTG